MSCAEALRRCPEAVFVRPRGSLYREYSREVWSIVREIVPTVEQAGIDEGYLDLGEVAPAFDDARALAEAVRAVVKARTRLSCSLGVAHVEGGREGRLRPAQARRPDGRAPGPRGGVPRAVPDPACCRGSARVPRRGWPAVGRRDDRRARGARATASSPRLLPGKVGMLVRDRARGIDPRPLEVSTERISISSEETFERDVGDVERLHDELRRMADRPRRLPRRARADGADRDDEAPLPGLRDPHALDVARRRRPTTATRIGELACALLDRALRDRPGPLRLVGVGVSGLADHAQLELVL